MRRTMMTVALASMFPMLLAVGCTVPVEEVEEEDDVVGSAQQELPSYEVQTTFYSDATFSVAVGFSTFSCEGDRELDGTRTSYRYDRQYPCLNTPSFPGGCCYICSYNPGQQTCVLQACPPTILVP